MSIRKATTPTPDSEIGGIRGMQDLTLRNADNTPPAGNLQRWRQESELQCGFLFGCVGDLGREGGGGLSGLPVLLFQDEEAGSQTGGKQCAEWSIY